MFLDAYDLVLRLRHDVLEFFTFPKLFVQGGNINLQNFNFTLGSMPWGCALALRLGPIVCDGCLDSVGLGVLPGGIPLGDRDLSGVKPPWSSF